MSSLTRSRSAVTALRPLPCGTLSRAALALWAVLAEGTGDREEVRWNPTWRADLRRDVGSCVHILMLEAKSSPRSGVPEVQKPKRGPLEDPAAAPPTPTALERGCLLSIRFSQSIGDTGTSFVWFCFNTHTPCLYVSHPNKQKRVYQLVPVSEPHLA